MGIGDAGIGCQGVGTNAMGGSGLFFTPGGIINPGGQWILSTGFWNDAGTWDDAANGID